MKYETSPVDVGITIRVAASSFCVASSVKVKRGNNVVRANVAIRALRHVIWGWVAEQLN